MAHCNVKINLISTNISETQKANAVYDYANEQYNVFRKVHLIWKQN